MRCKSRKTFFFRADGWKGTLRCRRQMKFHELRPRARHCGVGHYGKALYWKRGDKE